MFVLGLGGAAVSIVSGDLSLSISGMSLAAIVGIILNLILKGEKEETVKIVKESVGNKSEIDKLKKDIKNELTVELKQNILSEIRKEMEKQTPKDRKKAKK